MRKSADVKSYFIGLELFRYISAMIYFGSDHTVTVTSTRYPPGSVKRPNYIQKGRTKHGRPLRSDEYPLKDLRRSDVEHGLDDSGELLPSDDATGLGDWEVERQAGLYVVGWYGPNDQEVGCFYLHCPVSRLWTQLIVHFAYRTQRTGQLPRSVL